MQIFNAYRGADALNVNGVTNNCWKCRKPNLAQLDAGSYADYQGIDVRHPYDVDVTFLNGTVLDSETYELREHGAFTLVIHSSTPLYSTMVTDLEGAGSRAVCASQCVVCVCGGV